MMSTTVNRHGLIYTSFPMGNYTDHFKEWARIYIAVHLIECKVSPYYGVIQNLYRRCTGRSPFEQ